MGRPTDRPEAGSQRYGCRSQPKRRFRPLIVGEAPSRTSDPARPVGGRCGALLADYAGLTPSAFARRFERANLLDAWPGKVGKGAAFPKLRAIVGAISIRLRFFGQPRTVVVLGQRAAGAFGVTADYFDRRRVGAATVVVVPHPSGINRWYNAAENRRRMRRFMRSLAKGRVR